jgi:cobalt-zinc-cadmium efflux system outer membrane protein
MGLFAAKQRHGPRPSRWRGAVSFVLFVPWLCYGQSVSTNLPFPKLTLEQARQTAFAHSWDLLSAKSGIDAATAQGIVAKEFPNPTASLSVSQIGTHDAATTEGNGLWHRSYDTVAAVTQLIEIAGKRSDRQAAARAGVMGAKARFYDAKRTLDQGVTKAYIAALLADDNAGVLRESARFMNREADIGKVRLKAGDVSESDFKQIQISAEQFDLQVKAAETAAVQARVQVEVLMGVRQPKGDWAPADSLEQLGAVSSPPAAPAPDAERPDVLAAQADLRGGQFNLKLQKALRIPDPTFSIEYEHLPQPPGPPADDTFGIGVSFPLPLWNLNRGNIEAARAAVAQFEMALGKARTQAAADAVNSQAEYQEASERWHRYKTQIVPQSASTRAAVSFAFEKGAATLVDLLEAERTDNTVRMAAAQAMSDAASAAADVAAAQTVVTELELNSRK